MAQNGSQLPPLGLKTKFAMPTFPQKQLAPLGQHREVPKAKTKFTMPTFPQKQLAPLVQQREVPKAKDLTVHPLCRTFQKKDNRPAKVVIKRSLKAEAAPKRTTKIAEKRPSVLS